jgi:hypothetical protein
MGSDGVPSSGAPQLDVDTESLDEGLRRMSLAADKTPTGYPVIPLSSMAPPPAGLGSISPVAGTMPLWTFLYGLNTVA